MLKIRGFLPFISIVFINAFIDLGHKIVIQNAIFRSFDGPEQITMTAIVNGLLLLPFISFFTPAGFFADKYPKHNVLQITLFFCVLATGIITLAYYKGWFWVAFP